MSADGAPKKPGIATCFICFQASKSPDISLHGFPTDIKIRNAWLKACGLCQKNFLPSRRICSRHFEENCFNKYNIRNSLYPDSIPTIDICGLPKYPMLDLQDVIRGERDAILRKRNLLKYLEHINNNRSSYVSINLVKYMNTLHIGPNNSFYKNKSPSPYVSPNIRLQQNVSSPRYVSPNIRLKQNASLPPYVSPCIRLPQNVPEYVSPSCNINIPQNASPVRNNSPPALPKQKPFCPNNMGMSNM